MSRQVDEKESAAGNGAKATGRVRVNKEMPPPEGGGQDKNGPQPWSVGD